MGLFRTFSPKYGTTLVFRGTSTDITTWYELKTPQSASQCVRIILAQGYHTLLDRKDCTNALLWSKTTLTTGDVGGTRVDPPP